MSPEAAAAAARRRTAVTRAFLVHMIAYGVAFPWAVAAVPLVFAWKEHELLAMASEHDAVLRVVGLAAWPAIAVFVVGHLPGLPWVLAARRDEASGKKLFAVVSLAVGLAGLVAAAVGWAHVLGK